MSMPAQAYQPGERRPIATRDRKASHWAASRLARWGVSANAISIAGLFCGVAAGALLATTPYADGWDRAAWLAAAALIQLRLLANMLDGMVAIASGRASAVGELYNEMPDRISDTAILVGVGYAVGGNVALGFTAACVAMFTAYVRAIGKVAGAKQEFCGPMAKPQRMFVATLVALYCGLTPESWQPRWEVASTTVGLPAAALLLIVVGSVVTARRRLVRIARTLKEGRP
jgi:phosphatidylglycerophosphate synthase